MTPDKEKEAKALRYLGLACRSRHVVAGTNLVLSEVRKAGAGRYAVFLASDASDRTKKQISDKCSFYGVSLFETASGDALAAALGKESTVSAVCVTDPSLAKAIKDTLD